jgi:hypothetical protein
MGTGDDLWEMARGGFSRRRRATEMKAWKCAIEMGLNMSDYKRSKIIRGRSDGSDNLTIVDPRSITPAILLIPVSIHQ